MARCSIPIATGFSRVGDLVGPGRYTREWRRRWFPTDYDESGSIGKRYRRQDEVGTPYCITIDSLTPQDDSVTIRDRDSLTQDRVGLSHVRGWIQERLIA